MLKQLVFMACALATSGCKGEHTEEQGATTSSWAQAVHRIESHAPWATTEVIELRPNEPLRTQLDERKIDLLRKRALSGSAESAWILRRLYAEDPATHKDEIRRWTQIAADNGHANAASLVAGIYEEQGGEENCLRAWHWYDRSGARLAAEEHRIDPTLLGNMDLLAQNWQACLDRGR